MRAPGVLPLVVGDPRIPTVKGLIDRIMADAGAPDRERLVGFPGRR